MTTTPTLDALHAQRQQLLDQIAALGDLRPGSLTESYRTCGKPTCHCAKKEARGHSQWLLTYRVGGKTRTRVVPRAALAETRAQITECLRLRELVAELIEVSEQVCQARAQGARRTAADEGKKSLRGADLSKDLDFEAVELEARRLALGLMGRLLAQRSGGIHPSVRLRCCMPH